MNETFQCCDSHALYGKYILWHETVSLAVNLGLEKDASFNNFATPRSEATANR